MLRHTTALLALAGLAAAPAFAGAVTLDLPVTETFDADNAGWADGPGNPAAFNPAGFITSEVSLPLPQPPSPFAPASAVIFRANAGASGDGFFGNYSASGVDSISFDLSNVSPGPFAFLVRLSAGPGQSVVSSLAPVVAPGGPDAFTTVTIPLTINDVDVAGFASPGAVLANVTSLQIVAVEIPNVSPGEGTALFALDNVTLVPAPGAAALLGLGLAGLTRRRR
jgi:uncharacterized protein (TIGR03382 family)